MRRLGVAVGSVDGAAHRRAGGEGAHDASGLPCGAECQQRRAGRHLPRRSRRGRGERGRLLRMQLGDRPARDVQAALRLLQVVAGAGGAPALQQLDLDCQVTLCAGQGEPLRIAGRPLQLLCTKHAALGAVTW